MPTERFMHRFLKLTLRKETASKKDKAWDTLEYSFREHALTA